MIDPKLLKILEDIDKKLLFLEVQLSELVESYEFIEEEPINEEYIAELSEKITERVYKDICKALKKDKFKFMGIA